jgi:Ni/Co efflux regulator RcnB
MHYFSSRMRMALAIIAVGILAAHPALAEKPPWAGNKKEMHENQGEKENSNKGHGEHGKPDGPGPKDHGDSTGKGKHRYFTEQHRSALHDYFAGEFKKGGCPPGLAKKRNGCLPPGQARKWAIGKPLPGDVVIFDLPDTVIIKLGKPPAGQRFVRVAKDILLIAVGTNMVMDAIEDLNWEFNR